MINIGINGFGRIGRMAFRAAAARTDVRVVAVNDLLEPPQLAYLLKHDSVHGRFGHDVAVKDRHLVVDGRLIRTTAVKDPAESAWGDAGADVVIESTGIFLTTAKAEAHLRAGARRVIISAPSKDDTPIFVHGVNADRYAGEPIISAASCTTNCLALIAKVLDEAYGIKRGLMTTIHATTATQKAVDGVSGKASWTTSSRRRRAPPRPSPGSCRRWRES
jgi:glyceraldehyde 3-phosphate dehydrogenase